MTTGEVVAMVSAIVAALALAFNLLKDKREQYLSSQGIRDKLDYISDTARDTREDVRALDRKMDDHAARITKVEARLEDHDRRIGKIEDKEQT